MKSGDMSGQSTHVVVLIHGIRTHASWGEMVAAVLESKCDVRVIPIKYGYFDLFRFLCPILTRSSPIRKIRRELRAVRSLYPNAEISVIAHSFGTYALFKSLLERDIKLHRVILCGSIISAKKFQRLDYASQLSSDIILNDCGTHDIWPVIASSVTWGYGSSGTFGLGTVGVRDRFNKFGHGEYFCKNFVENFWVPYIQDGVIVPTEWESVRIGPPWWQNLLSWFSLKYVALLSVVITLLVIWKGQEANKIVSIGLGPQFSILHSLGLPGLIGPLEVVNQTSKMHTVDNIRLSLISPEGNSISMNMEGILLNGQPAPALTTLAARPKEKNGLVYTFFNYIPEYNVLNQDVMNYAIRSRLLIDYSRPDPEQINFSNEITERIQRFARDNFIWKAGRWTLKLDATYEDGKKLSSQRYFELTEDEIQKMWNITNFYKSGIGVFPVWRHISIRDAQPVLVKDLIE